MARLLDAHSNVTVILAREEQVLEGLHRLAAMRL